MVSRVEITSDPITAGLGCFHHSSSFINMATKGELGSDPQIQRGKVPSDGDGHISGHGRYMQCYVAINIIQFKLSTILTQNQTVLSHTLDLSDGHNAHRFCSHLLSLCTAPDICTGMCKHPWHQPDFPWAPVMPLALTLPQGPSEKRRALLSPASPCSPSLTTPLPMFATSQSPEGTEPLTSAAPYPWQCAQATEATHERSSHSATNQVMYSFPCPLYQVLKVLCNKYQNKQISSSSPCQPQGHLARVVVAMTLAQSTLPAVCWSPAWQLPSHTP